MHPYLTGDPPEARGAASRQGSGRKPERLPRGGGFLPGAPPGPSPDGNSRLKASANLRKGRLSPRACVPFMDGRHRERPPASGLTI